MRSTANAAARRSQYRYCCTELAQIAEQNDLFRSSWPLMPQLGRIKLSEDISAQSGEFQIACLEAVRAYSDFSSDNDPHGTHEAGSFEVFGKTLRFEIVLYDATYATEAADPLDLEKTRRILTIYSTQTPDSIGGKVSRLDPI